MLAQRVQVLVQLLQVLVPQAPVRLVWASALALQVLVRPQESRELVAMQGATSELLGASFESGATDGLSVVSDGAADSWITSPDDMIGAAISPLTVSRSMVRSQPAPSRSSRLRRQVPRS